MPYLFAAFSVVWIVIFLYALSISRRQRELSREVETLRRMTEERTKESSLREGFVRYGFLHRSVQAGTSSFLMLNTLRHLIGSPSHASGHCPPLFVSNRDGYGVVR